MKDIKKSRSGEKGKFKAFSLGFIASLILLELVLRFIGIVHVYNLRDNDGIEKGGGTDYVILCLGDSYTEGIGASRERSFPKQLEAILNNGCKNLKFKVINRGRGSYNTSLILEEIGKNLDETKPDLVIILAGKANFWNSWGYTKFLHKETCLAIVENALYEIKLYKLVRVLLYNIKEKLRYSRRFNHNVPDLDKSNLKYRLDRYFSMGLTCVMFNRPEEAQKWFSKALELDPQGDPRFYAHLAAIAQQSNKPEVKTNILKNFRKYEKFSDMAKDSIEMLSDGKKFNRVIGEWIDSDLEAIIRECRKRNMKIILQDYPLWFEPESEVTRLNSILREFARSRCIPFVDQALLFHNLFNEGVKEENYYTSDMHCNELGYGIMANNLSNKIKTVLAGE